MSEIFGCPQGYPWVDSKLGKMARYLSGAAWGIMMGLKSIKHSPNDPNNIDIKTKDCRDKIQSFFGTFTFFTLMTLFIRGENKKDEINQFAILGALIFMSLLVLTISVVRKKRGEYLSVNSIDYENMKTQNALNQSRSRFTCWGSCINFFKSYLPGTQSNRPATHDALQTNIDTSNTLSASSLSTREYSF